MMKHKKWYGLGSLLLSSSLLIAQNNLQVHSDANVRLFDGATMAVYGDVTQEGTIGSEDNSAIRFYGNTWMNDIDATHPGNGWVQFMQPNTLYGTDNPQNLEGSGLTTSFPQMELDNTNGLYLLSSDAKVRQRFRFTNGHVILDENDLVVGDGFDPGTMEGYDESKFVVTNGSTNSIKGFLIREGVGGTGAVAIEFPVGTDIGLYSPTRLVNSGTPDAYYVRVFPDVFENGTMGTLKNDESVGRTWEIMEFSPNGSDVELYLQYDGSMEGADYDHSQNFITRYIGMAPNVQGGYYSLSDLEEWDFVGADRCNEELAGDITTGTLQSTAWNSYRSGIKNFSDYTLFTPYNCSQPEELFIPNVFTPNGDGYNDTWDITNIQLFEKRDLIVINRWGDVVYKSQDYQNDWDGTYASGRLPAGTYYFILDLGEPWGVQEGDVTIIRE